MEEDKSDLEKLKKRLYKSDEEFDARLERERLRPITEEVEIGWKEKENEPEEADFRQMLSFVRQRKNNLFSWILVFSLGFLLISGAFLYFFGEEFIWGTSVVSSKKIDVTIEGPSLIDSGENNKWYVSIDNKNKVNLELADLIIEYPAGSLSLDGERLTKERRSIGKILADESVKEEVVFFVAGEKDEEKEIFVTLEYRMEQSNAIFAKSANYLIKLSQPPLGFSLELPESTESGQQIKIKVEYVSNSEIVLKDLYIKMEYPPGFQFIKADMEPTKSNNIWSVGDLPSQEKRSFEIEGILEGQDLMEVVFRVLAGIDGKGDEFNVFASETGSIFLKSPFLSLEFLVGGQSVDSIYKTGSVSISIPWRNSLATEIRNVNLEVKLTGDVIDFQSLSVNNGFYRAYDKTIVWNASSMPSFSSIIPGQNGYANFSFNLKDIFSINRIEDKNFMFKMGGQMSALQISGDDHSSIVKGSFNKEIKIASDVQLASNVSYSSGSSPPKVGQETTYMVTWSISNFYNDISNTTVRASLPPYISWPGIVEPSNENFVYNPATGELIWTIDRIESATGVLRPARQVSFKINFLPAINQVDSNPFLVSSASLETKDLFTDLILRSSTDILRTDKKVVE